MITQALAPKCVYCARRCWPWQPWGGRYVLNAGHKRLLAWHKPCLVKQSGIRRLDLLLDDDIETHDLP